MPKLPPKQAGHKENPRIAEMLRVDHAGEYAAVAIYRGQQAVFKRSSKTQAIAGQLSEMEAEEQKHLDAFDKLLVERDVRPTAMTPIWNAAGYGLGVVTALMGEKAAHACTEAVENVIEQHYGEQVTEIKTRSLSWPPCLRSSAKMSFITATQPSMPALTTPPLTGYYRA